MSVILNYILDTDKEEKQLKKSSNKVCYITKKHRIKTLLKLVNDKYIRLLRISNITPRELEYYRNLKKELHDLIA